jgi:hypothetical protein
LPHGEQPNNFLKKHNLLKRSILFPAEGEGRNAIYVATRCRNVHALIKVSRVKKKKAQTQLTSMMLLSTSAGEFQSISYQENQFDAVALIYAHFPADKKSFAITKY